MIRIFCIYCNVVMVNAYMTVNDKAAPLMVCKLLIYYMTDKVTVFSSPGHGLLQFVTGYSSPTAFYIIKISVIYTVAA